MVFSDSTTKQGLVEDVDFLCGTDSTSYPIGDKTRNINRHYQKAVISMLKASGRFQFDDKNATDLAIYTFDLVNDQQQYSLPTDLLKLEAIEIKDANGNWTRLQEVDIEELRRTVTDFQDTPGIPRYYDVSGDSFFLYPAPSTTLTGTTAAGKVFISRTVTPFATDDTTEKPGFAETFHRILSLGAAYDYLVINSTTDKTDRVLAQYEQLMTELREFYGDRNRDKHVGIDPAHNRNLYA